MTTSAEPQQWWNILVETDHPEDTAALLIAAGASGAEEVTPRTTRVCVLGDAATLERFKGAVPDCGGRIVSIEPVEWRNWVQEAEAHWTPLQIGQLHIIPVLDSGERARPGTLHPLYINPGTGFGTGHHPTTHMVLELLQSSPVQRLAAHSPALDLGTGSGILALAASELYGSAVDAIEIDPLALENAAKNVALNPNAGRGVKLIEGDLAAAGGPYPLMMANIYAEVLCELEPGFAHLATPETKLVVSGIMSHLKESVLTAYRSWHTLSIREERGWIAILFSRG
jgi:ribosomal protein L11 methyltransferase